MAYKQNQFQIDALNNTAILGWVTDLASLKGQIGPHPQVTIFGVKFDVPPDATRQELERAALLAAKRDLEELLAQLP